MVRLKRDLPENNLKGGARGTVLIVHAAKPPAYEVEFLDGEGQTIALLTLKHDDLELLTRPKA
ncbi:MAG: DUF4926 domain-containing protein [Planctomycetes bacterium]|nr:DUF4926 domain-containing protein [Planctomycetota bacterium]